MQIGFPFPWRPKSAQSSNEAHGKDDGGSAFGILGKIAFAFALLTLVVAGVGFLGLREIETVNARIEHIGIDQFAALKLIREGIGRSTSNSYRVIELFWIHDRARQEQLLAQRAENSDRISKIIQELELLNDSAAEGECVRNLKNKREAYVSSYKTAMRLLFDENNPEMARAFLNTETLPKLTEYQTAWYDFAQFQNAETQTLMNQNVVLHREAHRHVLILIAGAIGLALGIAGFSIKTIVREISRRLHVESLVRKSHEQTEALVVARTSELRQANEALRLQGAALMSSANGIIITDQSGTIQWVNPAFTVLSGYSSHEAIGQNPRMLKSGAHSPEFYKNLWKTIRSGNVWHGDMVNRRKDGTHYHEEMTIAPVPGDNGKITHFVSVKQDATERRKAALKLQTSEKQYRKLFEGNPNPMWVYDSETLAFLAVNHAAVHKYGYSEQEFLSMTIKDIRPPEDIPALMRDLSQNNGVLQSGSQWRHRKKDGELIDVEMSSHQSDWLGRRARLVLINDITERKRAEDALNASRQLIEGILNAIPISVFWKDENLNYLGGNRQFAQDAGFNDPKDIIGKNDYQMGWRDNADLYRRDDREVIESGCAKLLIEEPQTTPEGNIITLLTSKVPLRDSKGEISGVIGAYLDITERKRMEAQRDRLAALVEASPDFIGFADPKTERIQYINKNGRRMCGIGENEDLTALDVRDLHPAWMNQKIAEVVFPTAIQHGLWEGEGAFLHRSGGEVPVSMALMARKDATGEVDLFYTVSRDISEHKRAARVLRDANERFEIVTRATTNVIWDWDLTNNSIWWNDHFHVVFGYPAEEAGTALESWTSRIHPDDLQRVHHKIFEVINSAELKWSDEYRFRRHNGEYACVMDRGHVLRDEQGKAFRMIGAMEDITQRKEAAAKLRHAHDQLEKRVIERTADLEQARAAAEKANQSKSEFLSRMSHELRTPLNAILGFAQLLELDGLQSQSAESVDQILKGGHHLLDLINEVLDIARIETGNGRLSVEPVSVREVIEEARALLGQYPTNHSIKIDICPSCLEDLFVMADRQRLKQVLLNLLSNAVKYNRDGGSVLVTCEMSSEDLLRINVRDTGLGIPPDKIEEAFIPFKRLHTQTCEAEGTGLGLSLSRQLIQAMGGRIGATSAVNEGSNFWIELPLAQKTAESAADDFKYTNLPELEGRARTILYIEDNLSNLKLIERVLESRKNIKLLSVMQGSMGISMAREHQPDLILLDLGLPDIPGEEVLSRLKSDPKIHKIPVVVLSADATQKQIDRLLSLGAIRYLTKPLNLRSFVDALIQQFKEAQ